MTHRYTVVPVGGLKPSQKRGLAFLCSDTDGTVNARDVFGGLAEKREWELRSRFDYWIDGGTNNRWFHGWDAPKYRLCFVFKWKDRKPQRIYGFLCHPTPNRQPRFELCVLVLHAQKTERETDTAELDRVNALRVDSDVLVAIGKAYPDTPGVQQHGRRKRQWVN